MHGTPAGAISIDCVREPETAVAVNCVAVLKSQSAGADQKTQSYKKCKQLNMCQRQIRLSDFSSPPSNLTTCITIAASNIMKFLQPGAY